LGTVQGWHRDLVEERSEDTFGARGLSQFPVYTLRRLRKEFEVRISGFRLGAFRVEGFSAAACGELSPPAAGGAGFGFRVWGEGLGFGV